MKSNHVQLSVDTTQFIKGVAAMQNKCSKIVAVLNSEFKKMASACMTVEEFADANRNLRLEFQKEKIRSILDSESVRFDNLEQRERVVERLVSEINEMLHPTKWHDVDDYYKDGKTD